MGRGSGMSDIRRITVGYTQGRLAIAVALLVAAVALLLTSAPAMAFSERGHAFGSAFGSTGTGNGQFSSPSGVAVNETTGDIFVVDRGNNRVERLDSSGKFISAWGWGVAPGAGDAKTYSVCTAPEACEAGTPGSGKGVETFKLAAGRMISPTAIAVDNSASSPSKGDVYVVAASVEEKSFVYKFTETGEYLGHLTSKEETEFNGYPTGVAVDPRGEVWVAWSESELNNFTNAVKNKRVNKEEEIESEPEATLVRQGFAVDSHDNLLVNFEPAEVFEPTEEGILGEEGKAADGSEACEPSLCFVSKLTSVVLPDTEPEIGPGEAVIKGFDAGQPITSIAVDPRTDGSYILQRGFVRAFTSEAELIQQFGEGQLTKAAGVTIDSKTGTVYITDAGANAVEVYPLEPPAKPVIASLSTSSVGSSTASLNAVVDPTGASTTVTFEYGTSTCPGAGCTVVSAGVIGEDFIDHTVTAKIVGLAPSTTYHYRVLTSNSFGPVSQEATFKTQPPDTTFTLPDGRGWELVSPAEKNGTSFEAIPHEGGLIQASANGDAITYIGTAPPETEPEGNRSPAFTQNLAQRGSGSGGPQWNSKDIAIPNERAEGVAPGHQQEYQAFSADLSQSVVQPFGSNATPEQPLSLEATEKTIYLRASSGCLPAPSSCYLPIVTAENDTAGTKFGGTTIGTGITFVTATPDLSHVVFKSDVPLTTEEAAPPPTENLYEWTAGKPAEEQLQLINVLPSKAPASDVGIGEVKSFLVRHAISDDGSRIVFSDKQHIYTRNMLTRETVQVDVPEAEAELGASERALFQMASADGTRIFFTDEQRLTKGSTASREAHQPDLYEFDVNSNKLTDLTNGPSKGAKVVGLMPGGSEDGSTAYFVANGALTEAANSRGEKAVSGACTSLNNEPFPPGAACNLYVIHREAGSGAWGAPSLVAVLSQEDLPDWINSNENLSFLTSRSSPSGRYFAFMSQRPLTGYDNRDLNPAAKSARDEEVFLYDDSNGSVICPSCNPTGARPTGVFDQESSGEGLGLVTDRIETWQGHWLAADLPGWTAEEGNKANYQSRYLSDNGRLYFNSIDGLVSADVNKKADVYQYEPSGAGNCASAPGCVGLISSGTSDRESAFLDASTSGDDVFFLTAAPLLSQDRDTNFDVYDAHVCSTASPCVAVTSVTTGNCASADECKGASGSTPTPPAMLTGAASGNVLGRNSVLPSITSTPPAKKLTKAERLKKALKSCKKLKKKQKRVSCEKAARKKYGTKKKSKAKSKTGKR
jgi:hypothetical protein